MPEPRASSATPVPSELEKQSLRRGHDDKVKLNVAIWSLGKREPST